MKPTKPTKSTSFIALVLALVLALVGCSGTEGDPASPSSDGEGTSESTSSATANGLVGSPWVTSVLQGNLPAEQPDAKDDLYTHYNYEYLAAHQDKSSSVLENCADELQTGVTALIYDESKTGHDLEQLRILYSQAVDAEALKEAGLSEIQPYLDRIDAVTSIDELNELLVAEDFPFSPFIVATLSTTDTRTTSNVTINPNFVLCDALMVGGMLYQDSDDPQVQESMEALLRYVASRSIADLMNTGMSEEEAESEADRIIDFEKAYGRYLEAPDTYLKADYGALADAARSSVFTLDELCSFAPRIPLREMIDKLGKGNSETYSSTREWLEALNDLWTEKNLDTIKLVTKCSVLHETRPYRDPSLMNSFIEKNDLEMDILGADEFAYNACSQLDTLGNVVAQLYVEDVLDANAKVRLSNLSQDLVDEYKILVDETPWLDEGSRLRIIEKLDHMTLNVLEPQGGYFDYSGLELTPTEEGGTLFSNYLKLKQYRYDCESKLVGQPAIAAIPWFSVSPTTNNAFYDPSCNSINIFPGFVTSAIYTEEMDDADLLAGAGWTIGHEISHGFDYTGSQLDAYGTPNPVFTDAGVDAFVLKCSTLALYYGGIEITPGQMVDGAAVSGEATADLCGIQACLQLATQIDGFDYDKYFDGISHMWAETLSEELLQQQTLDVHPLANLRVNVSMQMFDAIYDEFGVTEEDGMYLAPNERIAIWGSDS